ncbi:MAG: hypothetical protein U0R68_00655 [Candidatus Nanopelagicales bacterium]
MAPTIGGYGFLAGQEYADGVDVAGQHLDFYLLACLTPVFNVASRHPVLNVPSGLGPNGVPTGVQVVARPYDDVTAFHAGAAAERELGIWNDPSWRPSLQRPDELRRAGQTPKAADGTLRSIPTGRDPLRKEPARCEPRRDAGRC